MARHRSRVNGFNALRKKLRRMDPEITRELRKVVRVGLHEIERDALGLVPVDEGDLARSIEVKLSRDGLTGIVGPGARAAEIVRKKAGSAFAANSSKVRLRASNKQALWQFFKGYWIEFGTKGSPEHNIPPQPPRPFMRPAYDLNRARLSRAVGTAISRALRRAARSDAIATPSRERIGRG